MKTSIKILIIALIVCTFSGLAIAAQINYIGPTTGKVDKTGDKTLEEKIKTKINIDKTIKEEIEGKNITTKDINKLKIKKITTKDQLIITEYTDEEIGKDFILITAKI